MGVSDSYEDLLKLLKTWQIAAGAKFNVAKTEIIPLGTETYRAQLLTTRRLHANDTAIADSVRITKDGEGSKILGTWTGNKVVTTGVWSPILDKIRNKLDRWEKLNPSAEGRSTIAQIYIGGYTQYMTAAHGMPKEIEKKIEKITSDFVWAGKKRHPVNIATMRKPKNQGGKNLFHVVSRNEAAYTVWLKDYLSDEELRPTWAYIADVILALNIRSIENKKVPLDARYNPFIQSWKPNVRKLPLILRRMTETALKYGVVPDAPYITDEARLQVPIWSHFARSRPNSSHHTKEARCLRQNHHIYLVNGLDELAEPEHDHVPDIAYACANCKLDRQEGCRHPYLCQEYARDILADIAPKWNLDTAQIDDELVLSAEEEETLAQTLLDEEAVPFNPTSGDSERLADYFRIFSNYLGLDPAPPEEIAQREAGIRPWHRKREGAIQVYACGSCIYGRTAKAKGGYAIHFPYGEAPDEEGACDGPTQTEQRSAATAVLRAVRATPGDKELHIVCNNKKTVERLTTKRRQNEDAGWTDDLTTADVYRQAVAEMRRRSARTTLTYINKQRYGWAELHQTTNRARDAARAATNLQQRQVPPAPTTAIEYDVVGAKLATMTQKRAHKIIKIISNKQTPSRKATSAEIAKTQRAIGTLNGITPTSEQIWANLRSKDVSRNVQNFQWKGLHGAHKVGPYFTDMPSPWKELATCPRCNTIESMNHILFECSDPARETIWSLAESTLAKKLGTCPDISIGTVWGCASAVFEDAEKEKADAKARVFRIIVSESAFLIWKARCERRIQHEDDPDWEMSSLEATNRWKTTINKRIAIDKALTNKRRHKRRALETQTVLLTWCDILENEESLDKDWLWRPGVLVGIGTGRDRQHV